MKACEQSPESHANKDWFKGTSAGNPWVSTMVTIVLYKNCGLPMNFPINQFGDLIKIIPSMLEKCLCPQHSQKKTLRNKEK
jgi:hypothetical protein